MLRRGFGSHFLVAIFHRGFAREAHAAFLVHAEAFHGDVVADFHDVLGLLHAEVRQFADVNQAVLAREEFHERAEFLHGYNFAAINLADLRFGGHAADGVHGNLHALRRDGEDVDRAIVLDVNFAAGFLDEALDVLATGSDDRADLLGVDLERGDARSIFADFLAWLGNGLGHFTENREAGDAGFFHGNFHDGMRQAFQLQVELEAGDAFFRAGDLAVHVAIRVFPADDIGEELVFGNAVAVVFGADADADAGDRTNHRNTRIEQREGAAADGRHRGDRNS